MIALNGYVKIHRRLLQWGWYKNSVVKDTFLHLIFIANFKDMTWQGMTIKRGQVVTSYKNLASDTGLTIQQTRTAIKKLKSTGEITSQSTNQFTILTLVNYEDYQCVDEIPTDELTGNATNEQQTSNKRATNEQQQRNKVKNDKNDKNIKNIYGEFQNVKLTDDEFEKLKISYSDYQSKIENLSTYIKSKGDKYKCHYATILNWARKDGDNGKSAKPNRSGNTDWGVGDTI